MTLYSVVRVKFTPRDHVNGRPIKPECAAHAGQEADALVSWRCDRRDGYAGEYALTAPEGGPLFGAAWVASGDVTGVG